MLGDDDDEVEHVDVDDDENDENGGEYSNEGETPHTTLVFAYQPGVAPYGDKPKYSKYSCPLWW